MKQLLCLLLAVALTASTATLADTAQIRVERDNFIYYSFSPAYLDRVDSTVSRTKTLLYSLLQDTLNYRPSIYIVNNLEKFNDLIGGEFPDWGAAAALPQRKLIAIKSPSHFNISRSLDELVAHEYAHLVMGQATGLFSAPRWFEEGLAMYVSSEWSWSDNLAMSKAAVFGQILDLREIDHVNRFNETKAHLAYAQSYLAVRFIVDNYDAAALNRFLRSLCRGGSANDAIFAATGLSELEFNADFRAHLNQRFNWVSLFMDTIFFWLGLAILVIIGSWLRVRKKRRYYRRWERQEQLESTDFDYGDPANPEKTEDDDEPWRA